jgi:saccharopine dehydrogenase-like NADP-dependent oxidoreductase
MKKKVLILGGGQMGSAVGYYLHNKGYGISIVDQKYSVTYVDRGIQHISYNGSRGYEYEKAWMQELEPDLIVNCLPSTAKEPMLRVAYDLGINYVDLSFQDFCRNYGNKTHPDGFNQGLYDLYDHHFKGGKAICVLDAGFAPGLTNLFVGRELAERGTIPWVKLWAGGVSTNPFRPYGYRATWSVDDLEVEYIRKARWCDDGSVIESVPSEVINLTQVRGMKMEGFRSDGLRTLLRYKEHVGYMSENTLRWPGHTRKVRELIDQGKFKEELSKCTEGTDLVIFKAEFKDEKHMAYKEVTMVKEGNMAFSAMAECTAFTCGAVCELVLEGVYTNPGLKPLEEIGKDQLAFDFILDKLAQHGIEFEYEKNHTGTIRSLPESTQI